MDLNFWSEDSILPQDVGLDFLDDQNDVQFGDLKEWDRLCGNWKPQQEIVEKPTVLSNESSLDDMSWMESALGSFLDALANQQEYPELPEIYDMSTSIPPENPFLFHQAIPSDNLNSNVYPPVNQDSMLTPPESPEHVIPVIKLEEVGPQDSDLGPSSPSSFLSPEKVILDGLDFRGIALPEEPLNVELQDSVDFIGSPLSADDVESMLSGSQPASPQSPNTSSLILSSPELYKVIAAPSNISNRFSPYSKQKSDQKPKSTKSSKAKKVKIDIAPCEDIAHLNKKDKKRLQNKNAAIRYRQKKKEEAESIHSEVDDLEQRNRELNDKVQDLEREIRYMKNLMNDIQKARGLSQ